MVQGLRSQGWQVRTHELEGTFPEGDAAARASLAAALAAARSGGVVVADGLAVGALPDVLEGYRELPSVALVHHALADESGLRPEVAERFRRLETRTLHLVRGVVVTSPFTAERLGAFGVAPDRLRVVVPGTAPALPARGPNVGSPPRLVCVGSVTPRKGHDVLVEALARIRDLEWACVCAGSLQRDERFAGEVRERVAELGLESRILFLGEVDAAELDQVYGTASLFVLPSRFEGYGMALTEALARGLPVVSTTGGAIPGTVPGNVGVLVPPGDAAALAAALADLLENPDRMSSRAEAAREHATRLPDWSTQAQAFGEAIRVLAGLPSGVGP
jgi:glycosyltransferase involved in cell wall biosynthesis